MNYTIKELSALTGVACQQLLIFLSRSEFAKCRVGENKTYTRCKYYDLDKKDLKLLKSFINRRKEALKKGESSVRHSKVDKDLLVKKYLEGKLK